MNLPFILDVGIGLLFIYLILSLLASEVQELLTTVLQWRAKHLRQAIETLLAGESQTPLNSTAVVDQTIQAEIDGAKQLTNNLYQHPLLKSLNQESKGILGRVGQWVSQLTNTTKKFSGASSAPSYVPSETFSNTLLSTLRIEELVQQLSEGKLNRLIYEKLLNSVRDIVIDLRNGKANDFLLERELQRLETDLSTVLQDFTHREVTLSNSFQRAASGLKRFLTAAEAVLPEDDHLSKSFLKRLAVLDRGIPDLLKESDPNIVEVVSELTTMSWVAQQLEQNKDPRTILARLPNETLRNRFQQGYTLLQSMNTLLQEGQPNQVTYQEILAKLPPHVIDSLSLLAQQAQEKAEGVQQGVTQLKQEVSQWFDRAMDRTAGVYKRNAKGVAIVIGFLLAVATNTDTLHIVNRLAKDPTFRETYAQAASELVKTHPDVISCLETAQDKTEKATCLSRGGVNANAANLREAIDNTTDLPLGWSQSNWQEQWQPDRRGSFSNSLMLLVGWLTSAIAISMGAPFWFNLLGKLVNIRNSGQRPTPVTGDQTTELRVRSRESKLLTPQVKQEPMALKGVRSWKTSEIGKVLPPLPPHGMERHW